MGGNTGRGPGAVHESHVRVYMIHVPLLCGVSCSYVSWKTREDAETEGSPESGDELEYERRPLQEPLRVRVWLGVRIGRR